MRVPPVVPFSAISCQASFEAVASAPANTCHSVGNVSLHFGGGNSQREIRKFMPSVGRCLSGEKDARSHWHGAGFIDSSGAWTNSQL